MLKRRQSNSKEAVRYQCSMDKRKKKPRRKYANRNNRVSEHTLRVFREMAVSQPGVLLHALATELEQHPFHTQGRREQSSGLKTAAHMYEVKSTSKNFLEVLIVSGS